jgi:hypothetical protein
VTGEVHAQNRVIISTCKFSRRVAYEHLDQLVDVHSAAANDKIHDPKGQPIANALVDVWQAGEDGLYSSQDPNKSKYELRGKFRSDRDGSYHFRSVVPKGYQIPTYRGEAFVVLLALLEKTGHRGAVQEILDGLEVGPKQQTLSVYKQPRLGAS